MKIIKTTLVAGLISIFAIVSSFAEKVKIGDPDLQFLLFLQMMKQLQK